MTTGDSHTTVDGRLAYWSAKLDGAPPNLELATDRARAPGGRSTTDVHRFHVEPAVLTDLEGLCLREGVPAIAGFTAALAVLLARLAGQRDLVVGVATRGEDVTPGNAVEIVPVRVDLGSEPTFRELLAAIAVELREAHRQQVPLQLLADSRVRVPDPSRAPILQVVVGDSALATPTATPFDLELRVAQGQVAFAYRDDLFDRARIAEMAAQLGLLLQAMARSPDARVHGCSLLTSRARAVVPDPSVAQEAPLHDPVTRTTAGLAARTPHAAALEWRGDATTFADLETRATKIAAALRAAGVKRGDRVVVTGPRCPAIVAGILAVWKCGGVIVPLSESLPLERRRVMAREGGAVVALVAGDDPTDASVPVVRIVPATGEVVGAAAEPGDDVPLTPGERAPAYVFFTSGTTGTPKGVLGTHDGLAHFLRWQRETFGITSSDRAAQLTGLSFDVVLRDMLMPVSAGATLCFPDREAASLDPEALHAWLRDARITVMHSVPSVLESWLLGWRGMAPLESLRLLFMAGEPLSDTLVRECRARFPRCRIVNLYGPTETTLAKCFNELPAELTLGTQPVGRPMSHTQAIVMSEAGVPCGLGEIGEIVIRTPFRTLGYLGDAARSSGRFRPNPFRDDPDDLLYATGDRGRYRLTGEIEIHGRVDDQVKIHGVRVQPAEVSAVIRAHPDVASCFVGVFKEPNGHSALCAYVVLRAGAKTLAGDLRRHLADRLPAAMVPASFTFLERLPLSANGKVDRKALPPPESTGAATYAAPSSPLEKLLAEAWAAVLRVDAVGRDDNFFDLGGQSLLATQIAARLRKQIDVDVPLRALFEHPTIAQLAPIIEAQRGRGIEEVALRRIEGGGAPASFAETRLWFLDQFEPGQATYNLPLVLRLRGALDGPALEGAVSALTARHESLRARFAADAEGPRRIIEAASPVAIELLSIDATPDADREQAVRQAIAGVTSRPFDLERGPLLRTTLIQIRPDDHVLVLSMHHIVSDGLSLDVLERELGLLYTSLHRGEPSPLADLPFRYGDYAAWQRARLTGAVLEGQLAYWKAHLLGAPASLDLPTDRQRPPVKRHRGSRVRVDLAPGLGAKVSDVARREDATSFMVLLAAFDVLLARHTGQKDIVVGMPIANRPRAELEGVVGFFVNTLAVRTDLAGEPTFREVVQRVKRAALGAYEHQDVPFERLVEELKPPRDTSRTPLFQVMFAHQTRSSATASLEGLGVSVVPDELDVAKFDLTLNIEERDGELAATLQYDSDLFDRSTAERIAERYRVLLGAALDRPDERVMRLGLMPEAEHRQLAGWNATARVLTDTRPIHRRFEAEAARSPDRIAIEIDGETLTYGELDARANDLAHVLVEHGVGRDVLVAVSMDRSLELLIALYAVLKAGGAYAPLDPGLPSDRLAFMTRDLQARALLVRRGAGVAFDTGEARVLEVDARGDVRRSSRPDVSFDDLQLAYVIYTSGSTGTPKAAMNTHAGLRNRLLWMQDAYPLDARDRVLQKTPFTFDVSVWELFWPLAFGARLVLARPEGHKDPAYLAEVMARAEITTAHFVPSMLQAFLEEPTASRGSLTRVICSGEALPRALAARFHERIGCELHNLYGPTEASIDVTYWPCARDDAREIPIGRPIWNTQIHVVDENGTPCPIGVAGEIWIGGTGVGRGYWRRPELTAEKFIADPFAGEPGRYLYRAGDLGRYRADGAVEYLGRIDHQVKVRGFRIELGEIEAAIAAAPSVREVVVVAREDATGDKRLVAYVVGPRVEVEVITAELRRKLPDYMVPSAFVVLAAFPLTSSGKVDRKALPAPDFAGRAAEYVAPRTRVEQAIAKVWKELLRVERVGAHDDFFALGGHSLLATRAAVRLRAALGVDVRVRTLFELPTLSALAERLTRAESNGSLAPIARVARAGPVAASFAQERLWFLAQLDPMTSTYNVDLVLRLRGPLDVGALERSVNEIVRRHEVLRTTLPAHDGRPQQRIQDAVDVAIVIENAVDEGDVRARVRAETECTFDLARGPLLRAKLVRVHGEEHVLVLVMHHIVTDGWSAGVIERELSALYGAFREGRPSPLDELPIQYADYAVWQREFLSAGARDEQLAYWKAHLAGAPASLDLPTDRPRPTVKGYRGSTVSFELPRNVATGVADLARGQGATPFMVLLAAFDVLLARHTGQTDLVVGTPIANRPRAELEGLIGFFVNTLALRTSVAGDPSFREVVQRVKATALGAYEHQDLPFERLVEELRPPRDTSRTPIFQVMFAHVGASGEPSSLAGLEVSAEPHALDVAKFDLLLTLEEASGGLRGSLQYDTALFDAATAEHLAEHFGILLEAAVERPDTRVNALPVMSEAERRRVIVDWNATARAFDETPIHEVVERRAAATPSSVAIVDGSEQLTYAELNRRANRIARYLRQRGLGREDRIATLFHRSADMVVAALAVMKAGGAYVPLDPAHPAARLAFIVQDAGAGLVLSTSAMSTSGELGVSVVNVDAVLGEEPSTAGGDQDLSIPCEGRQAAYVIYTSGTTGQPKGAVLEHRGLANLVTEHVRLAALTANDRVSQIAGPAFDATTGEIWPALWAGASLHVFRDDVRLASDALVGWLRAHEVTVAYLPTALLEVVLDEDWAGTQVRVLSSGGQALRRRPRGTEPFRLLNIYGPTETTNYVTSEEVEPGTHPVTTIGRPIQNTSIYVLDGGGTPAPIGVYGELCVGGANVGRGYVGRPALTAEKFVPDPFAASPGARLYRTGDRARWTADGRIEFAGRDDDQVKIRGFRIELGEIEAVLRASNGVRAAVVAAREEARGERRIIGYVVPAPGFDLDVDAVQRELRRTLPEYMVPSTIVVLDALPLTANGKVDLRALPAPDLTHVATAYVAPRNRLEQAIGRVWCDVLGLERVSVHDDFFALGGHSLLATRVASRLREALGTDVPVRLVFEATTISELAVRLGESAGRAEPGRIARAADTGRIVPSFAQDRLWFLAQLDPEARTYNVPLALRLRGPLAVDALARSLVELTVRHEVLRTTFDSDEGRPRPVVRDSIRLALDVEDVADESAARERVRAEVQRPFDLAKGPLFRATLLRIGAEDHLLVLVMHHVVTDGWSMTVLQEDLSALYGAFARDLPSALAELPIRYADYAAWQRDSLTGPRLAGHLAYWKEHLQGAPTSLELSTDHPRPAVKRHRGASVSVALPPGTAARVSTVAREAGATPFMVLLAAFDLLVARHTNQDDVVVGTPIANRTRTELEGLVGFFVNTLALRTRLDGDPTFREVVQRVKRAALGAYEHQDVPFERLVEELKPRRDPSRTPLFEVMFAYQTQPKAPALHGLAVSVLEDELDVAKFDLTLFVEERDGELAGSLQYDSDLFERSTAERIAERYAVLLEAALDRPDARVAVLPVISAAERRRVVVDWNATRRDQSLGRCIDDLFEEHAARAPHAPALVLGTETMTYGQLAEASSRVAAGLRAAGIGREARVGISSERSIDLIVGLLGILKAGAAYVPLDPAYPQERIELLVNEARVEVVLDPEGRLRLPMRVASVRTSDLREHAATPAPAAKRPANGAAFVLFTSGSTGLPKGVCIEHRAAVRLVRDVEWASMTPSDVFLAYAPLSFDASTLEIWGPLVNGAKLVIAPPRMLGPDELAQLIRENGITFLFLTSGLFHQLVDQALDTLGAVPQVFSGGDVLSPSHVRRVVRELPQVKFVNAYGPTENGTITTAHLVRELAEGESVPIGRPITNTTVYLLDAEGEPTPIGVPGELYTGGAGVARGYVRAAATAEKFVPDPFSSDPGARLYRTGDLARWRADGTIDFLGRRDGQVKLRGFRIELGEIEAALALAPHVREVTVVARQDESGDKRLVAYLTTNPGAELDVDGLKSRLRRALPDYMVPSAFVVLDALPLTTNGKVDRKALPAPDFAAAAATFVAPRNRVETTIAEIWCGVLGLERVGVHDDFFALGGHSLLATRVASQLRASLGLVVPVGWLFEAPVLEVLARRVADARVQGTMPPAPRDRADAAPLRASFAQERMWFLAQLDPDAPTYNAALVLRFRGPFDVDAFARGIDEIVRRHESLRTTLREIDGRLYQVVHDSVHVPLVATDAADESAVRASVRDEVARPFDLEAGPVLRARLIGISTTERILVLVMHHVVTDGWSIEVIRRELRALTVAFGEGKPSPLPPLPIQYADYAAWQRERLRGPLLDMQLAYWSKQLAGAPGSLDLPTDRPRPAMKRYRGATVPVALPQGLAAAVAALAKHEGGTPFMVLLAAFDVVLGRHAGQTDIVVGTPIANRTRPEVEGLVGFFANTLPLRTKLDGAPTFRAVIQRVKQAVLGGFQHEDVPFERLVEALKPPRDTSRTPIFQAMFTHHRVMPGLPGPPGREVTVESSELGVSKFDLTLSLEEGRGELAGSLEYDTDLFDRSTAERMAERFRVLLEAAVARPDTRAAALPMMSSAERERVAAAFNATRHDHGPAACVHELFEEQARRTPDACAVQDDRTRLSYGELDARAESVAAWLEGRHVGPDARVAVTLARSVDMIAAVLGVLKAGAAYVPIDPKLPEDRRAFMKQDAGCVAELTDSTLAEAIAMAPRGARTKVAPGQLAYVLYTSGSTGRPKGVMVEHRGLTNLVRSLLRDPGMAATDVELALTTLSFDVAGAEIYVPLVAGARIVVASEEAARDPALLSALIERTGANVAGATPATWRMLTSSGWHPPATMTIHCAGEALPRDLADELVAGGATLFNLYGPTETTIYATGTRVTKGERITIGRPLDNTQTYVLDAWLQPVPIGVVGQLFIAGTMVARGYLGRPDLTAEKFVPDPFSDVPGARMYATGDLACWLEDGTLDYLGRSDNQVKVRGFRIELGEIEATLRSVPGIREAVVVARESGPGDKRLVAYVAPRDARPDAMKEELRRSLPEYMVPSAFVLLDALPLTGTGKVDRNALPSPDFRAAAGQYVAPRNALETTLAQIWSEVLGVDRVGVHDDFFALGGHSLMAVKLVASVRERLDRAVPLAMVFDRSTVAGLAEAIEGGSTDASRLVRLREGRGAAAIVCVAPIGGELVGYVDLVRTLADPGIVLGLRARGIADEEAPLESVEDIAAEHVAALRGKHEGPYVLVGWSFGGVVAFEMARQLDVLGIRADVVAVDAYPAVSLRRPTGAELLVDYLQDLIATRQSAALALTADDGIEAVWARAIVSGSFSANEVVVLRRTFAVYEANLVANARYRPAPAPIRVHWMRASASRTVDVDAARACWTGCAERGLVETLIEADHYTVMRGPAVTRVAQVVSTLYHEVNLTSPSQDPT